MRAQEHLFSDIEGILRITRRVIRRNIQRLKVIVIPLDLRAGGYLKAHAEEDFLYLIEHNRERVLMAKRAAFAGIVTSMRSFSSCLAVSSALSSFSRVSTICSI